MYRTSLDFNTSLADGDGYSCRPLGYLCSVCRRLLVVKSGVWGYFTVRENIKNPLPYISIGQRVESRFQKGISLAQWFVAGLNTSYQYV